MPAFPVARLIKLVLPQYAICPSLNISPDIRHNFKDMNIKITIFFLSIFFLFDCSNSGKSLSKLRTQDLQIQNLKYIDQNGPPFTDTCSCSFNRIGGIKSEKGRFDLIIEGKGWNPNSYSCTYSWGELISNEFPPDSSISDFRIHLLDVAMPDQKIDSTFLKSEIFNNNLIATYSKCKGEKYMTCKFDPNNTGKYPRPRKWIE